MIDPAKYAVREAERKFLLAGVPEGLPPGRLIEDTYLPGTRLRLRRVTEPDGTIVRKLGQKVRSGGPESLWHTTMYLDENEWAELCRTGAPLRKRRHLVGDPAVAVDVFEGDLDGLVLAEVDRGDGPDDPDLITRLVDLGLDVVDEVGGDETWTGAALAFSGRPDLRRERGVGTVIREFREPDWAEIEPIVREALESGETYCADPTMTSAELRRFWLSDAHTVVAEIDGVVVGTAHCGPNRPAQGSHVGTASFMVGGAARGHGIGRALGEHVIEWHRRNGFRGIQFNAVVETNEAAVSLWRSLGFEIVGTVPDAFRRPSGEYVGLHVMYRDIGDPEAPEAGALASPARDVPLSA